ncbi:hypothetical protein [Perlabentimonas gracilis]|uniref:hypothetical protein n=1 Tax=Perlabentimonas gracilis TaxID=2715279 RepID=UPI00140BD69B|nr:hypothetical protein [Perlabentimonas gracilis]NHB70415.1 hypothetical protein [Perlabentimonas gracilis]
MKTRIKTFLIRLLYIIPFLIFAYAFIEQLILVEERFRKIDYKVLIPMIIFLYQSIRNSIVGWILIVLLYLAFLYLIIEGIIRSIEYLGGKTDLNILIFQFAFALIYLGLSIIYWKIRPKNRLI